MKLPQTQHPQKYIGLYVLDFADHCAIGYTADEVAALLESEQFQHIKAYKIYRASPNGQMELIGVPLDRFQLESGIFFLGRDDDVSQQNVHTLLDWAKNQSPPCRAKLQLTRQSDDTCAIALIYPAEYEQEMGQWLQDSGFFHDGPIDAGISQVTRFYQSNPNIIRSEQLWPAESLRSRDRQQLLNAVGCEFQR